MDQFGFALEVLQYWYLIEFLSQNNFPTESQENKLRNDQEIKKPNRNQITVYCNLNQYSLDPTVLLKKDSNIYSGHSIISDEVSICLGKINRNLCVEYLHSHFGSPDNRVEINSSQICLIGLRCDNQGYYIPKSFNLSPLLWGIVRLKNYRGNTIDQQTLSALLSTKAYAEDIRSYESILTLADDQGKTTGVKLNAISLENLYKSIYSHYVSEVYHTNESANIHGIMIYHRYKTEEAKAKDQESLFYSDLCSSFFTQDLQMVIKNWSKEFVYNPKTLGREIMNYITDVYAEENHLTDWINKKDRTDIRSGWDPEQPEQRELFFHTQFDICKAPIGKWPSKYMPSLMQQLAINLSLQTKSTQNKLFSVNGPPGTGKTTLLKEIIAENVVQRAILLAKYSNADEAFVRVNFKDGTKVNHGYSKYYSYYYKFKDDAIKQYGMLVASCNNNAVENITKELPDSISLKKGLMTSDQDALAVKAGLREVADLFDIENTHKTEQYLKIIDNIRTNVDYPEIYFSKFANDLNTEKKDIKRWGLISAPLGKSINILAYSKHVLKPLTQVLFTNENIEKRKQEYSKSIVQFRNQLETVKTIQGQISETSNLYLQYISLRDNMLETCQRIKSEIQESQLKISIAEKELERIKNEQSRYSEQLQIVKREVIEIPDQINKMNQSQTEIESRIELLKQKIIKYEKQRTIKDWFFEVIKKKTLLSEMILDGRRELSQIIEIEKDVKTQIQNLSDSQIEKNKLVARIQEQILSLERNIAIQSDDSHENRMRIQNWEQELTDIHSQIQRERNSVQSRLNSVDDIQQAVLKMTVINENFWKLYDSQDIKENTRAQCLNPWMTEEYNREREKLFFYALQLHREFVLSSKACSFNYKNLLLMWHQVTNEDSKIINYSRRDREASFGALFNTVFLITPVISTTFASLGTMLSDIQNPAEIGLLIVDEAGQASPQMTLGALYRCQRAIIVGDPKQVEPVVTDDMDAIKQVLKTEVNYLYQSKKNSAQEFADRINTVGTYFRDIENDSKTWVGCPLIVHRRCISPMVDIANAISYDNAMKSQTAEPSADKEAGFCLERSGWINISGSENNSTVKDHFVAKQGEKVLELLRNVFKTTEKIPDVFVITPFTSVKNGLVQMLKSDSALSENQLFKEWIKKHVGTVHTFQGKEADEVIFLLGCDKNSLSAVKWVNANIINVAVTRAKYRLVIIGDYTVWQHSQVMEIVKSILDSHAIAALNRMSKESPDSKNRGQVQKLVKQIPGIESLGNDGNIEDSVIDSFSKSINAIWSDTELSEDQIRDWHLTSLNWSNRQDEVK